MALGIFAFHFGIFFQMSWKPAPAIYMYLKKKIYLFLLYVYGCVLCSVYMQSLWRPEEGVWCHRAESGLVVSCLMWCWEPNPCFLQELLSHPSRPH